MNTRFWQEATGHQVDPSKFMHASDVARTVSAALAESESAYVSDLVINRK